MMLDHRILRTSLDMSSRCEGIAISLGGNKKEEVITVACGSAETVAGGLGVLGAWKPIPPHFCSSWFFPHLALVHYTQAGAVG